VGSPNERGVGKTCNFGQLVAVSQTTRLLWRTNRQWHTCFWLVSLVSKSLTLD